MDILDWPFRGTEALAAQVVTPHRLRTDFEMVHRNVYIPRGQNLTAVTRAVAAWLWSGRTATVAGLSAAALHRTAGIEDWLPAELNRRSRDNARGITVHSDTLADDEICVLNGISVTTPARTAFDLGRRKGLIAALSRLDALAHATDVKTADIELLAERHRGARGLVQLRQILPLVDGGSESPCQTRTRLILIRSGLPRPQTQIEVPAGARATLTRVAMGWREWRVALEFDSAPNGTAAAFRTRSIDPLARLEDCGWIIVRISAEMLGNRPDVVLARVRRALLAAGCPI
ncbi:hypothetical protein MB901379_04065 [Mycobacterium basiliense]|uniref:Uncharacterized protein n=1 Tax=Mycobacterium basiliense TaxID=2094119 RepID=A0A447GJ27_9MYCO|nr:type IV toxin-antitoxin system AbiEi family antitoxin [Mycobacterium basiliense]VDM90464.1 hypothetical protein MB901379_04065 [Mycobacterium basiliense]